MECKVNNGDGGKTKKKEKEKFKYLTDGTSIHFFSQATTVH